MNSVCIATYNGEAYIATQLASILPQLNAEDEIIISDDASKDGTLDVVRSFNDSRIKITKGPATGSAIDNFEHALRCAHGDVIYLSDQDDCWFPHKIEKMSQALTDADCVVSDCAITDPALQVTNPSFFQCNQTHFGKFYNLLIKNGYIGGCMAFKRNVLEKALPFPRHLPMHDLWIGNVAAFLFRLRFIEEPLSYFRRSGNNVSTSGQKSRYSFKHKIYIRLKTLMALIHRMFRR